MKELIEQRETKLQAIEELRGANYNADKFKVLQAEIVALNEQIKNEQFIDAEKRNEVKSYFNQVEKATPNKSDAEFRSFLNGKGGNTFTIDMSEIEQRAAITTSSNSHFAYVNQASAVPTHEPELVLPQFGVNIQFYETATDVPSNSAISATWGTEDNAIADASLSTAKATLSPTFVSASLEVTKVWLQNSKTANIDKVKNDLTFAIYKALESKAMIAMSGLTSTATGTSFQNVVLQQEAAILGAAGQGGYILSRTGVERAKRSKIDSGSGFMVMQNGIINGYAAKRSALISANHSYFGNYSEAVALALFGSGITVEMVTDSTLARKGSILLIASALGDAKVVDSSRLNVFKSVNTLS